MMNTSAILPAVTGGTPGDASAGPSRHGAADDGDAGFMDLLSKLKGQQNSGADSSSGAQNLRNDDANAQELSDPLSAVDPRFNSSVMNLAALMQSLTTAGAATAQDVAGILSRVVNGTATDADEALVRGAVPQNGIGDLPEQAIGAALADMASQGKRFAETSNDPVGAVLTILRRETHFAPVQTLTGPGVSDEWAAELLARLRQTTLLANGSQAALISNRAAEPSNATSQIVSIGTAVTAATGGQLGSSSSQTNTPMDDLRWAAEALMGSGESSAVGNEEGLNTSSPMPNVTQQIAGRVMADAAALVSNTRPEAATTVKHGAPVKVLHIELQPGELGTVTIRMSVKDNALRLELEVGRHDTAQLIQRDREALSAMLRSAGYLIDGMEVRLADPASAAMQPGSGHANAHGQSGDQGSLQSDAGASKERGHHGRPDGSFGHGSSNEDEQAGRTSGPGGLYV